MSTNIYTHEYDVKEISKITFNIFGNEEIKDLSAIQNPLGIQNQRIIIIMNQ